MQKHLLILGMAGSALLPAQTQVWRGGGFGGGASGFTAWHHARWGSGAYYQPHFGGNGVCYTVVPNPF